MDIQTALNIVKSHMPFGIGSCFEAYKTLENIVLAKQTNNSAMDAIVALRNLVMAIDLYNSNPEYVHSNRRTSGRCKVYIHQQRYAKIAQTFIFCVKILPTSFRDGTNST
jgi:hypothetical protein